MDCVVWYVCLRSEWSLESQSTGQWVKSHIWTTCEWVWPLKHQDQQLRLWTGRWTGWRERWVVMGIKYLLTNSLSNLWVMVIPLHPLFTTIPTKRLLKTSKVHRPKGPVYWAFVEFMTVYCPFHLWYWHIDFLSGNCFSPTRRSLEQLRNKGMAPKQGQSDHPQQNVSPERWHQVWR